MTYTEKELNQFLHGISLSLLSKKSAQHWRYDEETAKEIEWLEALERKVRADKADRKTELTGYNLTPVEDEPQIGELKKLIFALNVLREKVRKYVDTADAPQTEAEFAYCPRCGMRILSKWAKDEPQIGEMMTEEEFDSMLARVLAGNNEPQTDCAWK